MNKHDPAFGAVDIVALGSLEDAPSLRRAGSFIFVSGIGSGHDIRAQTEACIEDLKTMLDDIGGGLENLVDVTTYLAQMTDFAGYNETYSKYFSVDGPARTTVAMDKLSDPDALLEMRGVAYVAQSANIDS